MKNIFGWFWPEGFIMIALIVLAVVFRDNLSRLISFDKNNNQQDTPKSQSVNNPYSIPGGWQLYGFVCESEVANSPCKVAQTVGNQTITWKSFSGNEVTVNTKLGDIIMMTDQPVDLYGDGGNHEVKLIVRRPDANSNPVVLVLIPVP